MTKTTNPFLRSNFIGLDRLWDELNRASDATSQFPKYNIIRHDDMKYTIEVALAGYTEDQIDIEVKDRVLHVSSEGTTDDDVNYLHKGVSTRRFHQTFRLSEYVVVDSAVFENGILLIHLYVDIPEEMKPRKIPIQGKREYLTG